MKVSELMRKCVNCDYCSTNVTIWDGKSLLCGVPNEIPERVKNMYVQSFKLGPVIGGQLIAIEITIEGIDNYDSIHQAQLLGMDFGRPQEEGRKEGTVYLGRLPLLYPQGV